jgi:hypothetical protein
MEHIYTTENLEHNGLSVIKISDSYWNNHREKFLMNKDSFDQQLIEFLKNVEDIHSRIESKFNIVVQTPPMIVADRHTFHTFSRPSVHFHSVGSTNNPRYRHMRIYLREKPDIPKIEVKLPKRILDENKLFLEKIKNTMFQQFETMWNTTMEKHFAN